jgi:hypothetical protein
VQQLMEAGNAVLCIDPFLTGEQHGVTATTERVRIGGFMDTFQPTDAAYRAQDIVTAIAFLRARRDLTESVALVGLEGAGVWALLASAVDGAVRTTVADLGDFDPDSDDAWATDYYIPCIRSIGDLKTAAALARPGVLYVAGTQAADYLTPYGAVALPGGLPRASVFTLLD